MTRRERHIRILSGFGSDTVRFHKAEVLARLGYEALTDEAVEKIARAAVSSFKRQQKNNREWRARQKVAS